MNAFPGEDFFDRLDSVARRYYPGYYVVVRDPEDPLRIDGITPDIVAGVSPAMKREDIRVVAMVGTEETLASGLPQTWKDVLQLSKGAHWVVDFFVPKSIARKVQRWVGNAQVDVTVIAI